MATGTVNSQGTPLNKRSGPGTNYPVVGSVPDGTTEHYSKPRVGERLRDGV